MSETSDFFERLDLDAADRMYQRISVDPRRFRRTLHTAGRVHVEEGQPRPSAEALRATGTWVIEQASFRSGAVGGIAGLSGAASVPAEVAARGLATLRLAQRLLLLYGFDPSSDRGQTALWKVLAAGLEIAVPDQALVGTKATDLPRAVATGDTRTVGGELVSALVRRTTRSVLSRAVRLVPLLGVASNARAASQRIGAAGHRMLDVLDRLYEPPAPDQVEDAEEVEEVEEGTRVPRT